jgi:glutamyl-Q tRNA(Asp) synthetase
MAVDPSQPVFRFAPSPNGRLHLGHAYSALFTGSAAKAAGGVMLLRIEDTDPERSKPEFDAAIIKDLRWLGLDWPEPVIRQSARFAVYAGAAEHLRALGLLYPCFCSRAEVAAASIGFDPDGVPLYAGTCRHLSASEIAIRMAGGDPAQTRIDMAKAMALAGTVTFTIAQPSPRDRPQIRHARPERWGDVVLQRKGTPTSYHLSVVVDDAAQGVSNVTRGRDMEAATDIHAVLQMLLGLKSPIYTFHQLILDEDGRKLSKSRGSPTLDGLRQAGWTPARIRAALGFG